MSAFPQGWGAVYEGVSAMQALGRVAVPPDGSFLLYEGGRPYDWAPDLRAVASAAGARKQAFIYTVHTPTEAKRHEEPTPQHLFPPAPSATYYLGNLSPDGSSVSFYELDCDDKKVWAGSVRASNSTVPKITWFEVRPDEVRSNEFPLWISNNESLYPIKGDDTKRLHASETPAQKMHIPHDAPPGMLATQRTILTRLLILPRRQKRLRIRQTAS
jgi:hypothetical protein